MNDDGLGDWRIKQAMRLAKDIPAAYPGGPSHKAGTPVYLMSSVGHKKFTSIGFATPSATAIALKIAFTSSREAIKLHSKLTLRDVVTPNGIGKSIDNLPLLYDFFEYCMSAVIFSFQAIETFSNWEIGRHIKDPLKIIINKKELELSAYDLQRKLSLGDKIDKVLPSIFKLPSPKGTKVWKDFRELKIVRDSTVHLKLSKEQSDSSIDRESLFFRFLNNPPSKFPKYAYNMVSYFFSKTDKPRWLMKLQELEDDLYGNKLSKGDHHA
jgi:hypothetical protein